MKNSTWTSRIAALTSVGVLTLTGCTTDTTPDETDQPTPTQSRSEHHPSHHHRE